ncbi:MAG TPA: hypothetical protein PK453_11245 [Leptospiraceae bacterium]|nr:hypothetical protein [Leptospiraceae bacterium]HMY65356.1 hypothetical protein [Leptospiraceae bacterium]HNF14237.1 hypothetical protein [Leptospiraceae bacterium]HNF23036.1 hypothetical protein [Leptospiraceae bacterium]HNI95818.1 hypothetical protein [Leptospiraceae bacterium]
MLNKYFYLLFYLFISSVNLFSIPVPNGFYLKQTEINPVTGELVLAEKLDRRGSRCTYSQFVYYPVWTSAKGYYCGYREYSKTDVFKNSAEKICGDKDWFYLNWTFDAYRIIAPCTEAGRI